MAEDDIPKDVGDTIDASIGEPMEKPSRSKKTEPSYRLVGDSKIPVSKSHGHVWKSRRSMGQKAMSEAVEAWDEAIRYFENDQTSHRITDENGSGNVIGNQRLNNNITETENVVFSNIVTMVPALYSRNPKAEFTSDTDEGKRIATLVERLVNALGSKKAAPGLNLKPKAKRCVVACLLTNRAWIEVGWTFKQESSEQALEDLGRISQELAKAKTPKEVEELEGQLKALEDTIDILQPSGPFTKYKHPKQVILDPNSKELDGSDAAWMMVEEHLPTQFLRAKYSKKKGDAYASVFKPTHILKLNDTDNDPNETEMADDYSVFKSDQKHSDFGFEDAASFEKAQMTKVVYVWDKTTRRVYLYNSTDWTWPLWVWDDPYQLDSFFPLFPLSFFEGIDGTAKKGEVTYYLDQQDAINEITDEQNRARKWAKRNIFYNLNIINSADVEKVLNGPDGTARGLNLPPEMKLSDVIGSITPPSMQYKELFDKADKYAAIDRISSTGDVMRGAQFKANTNTTAVNTNVSAANMRIDEKTDQIEDWVGQIYWAIAQLCLQFFSNEDVIPYLGSSAEEWQQMDAKTITSAISMEVVGGSSKKPTSQAKKEEAIEVGQVLGQFASVAPSSILVALQLLEESFDEIIIKEEDWVLIRQSVEQQMGGGQQQPQQGPPQQAGPQQPQQPPANGIDELLASMPPEIKQQVAEAIQAGVPPQQAIAEVQDAMQQPPLQ